MPRKNEPTARMCIVTRHVRPVDELVRFAIAPDGTVVPDLKGRLPGRGVWVTATADAVELAERRKLFARSFKEPVTAGPGLAEQTDERMTASLLGALGLARKAGTLITGFAKVESALAAAAAVGVIHALDASEDGIRKLDAAARRGGGPPPPVIRLLRSDQLDLALGCSHVIHAALLAGGPSEAVLERASALARFRGMESPLNGKKPSDTAVNASAGHGNS